jgi:hypothetical protein
MQTSIRSSEVMFWFADDLLVMSSWLGNCVIHLLFRELSNTYGLHLRMYGVWRHLQYTTRFLTYIKAQDIFGRSTIRLAPLTLWGLGDISPARHDVSNSP